MDHILAKQLRDKGFPHAWCYEDDCSCLTNTRTDEEGSCFPSLEKLIEECCKDYPYFTLCSHAYGWLAEINNAYETLHSLNGSTPKEAVAKLWLAINKKDDTI